MSLAQFLKAKKDAEHISGKSNGKDENSKEGILTHPSSQLKLTT